MNITRNDIVTLRRDLFLERFTNELSTLKDDDARATDLHKIIDLLNDTKAKKRRAYDDQTDEINRLVYKQPWTKLPLFHKEKLIDAYCDEKLPGNKDAKSLIKDAMSSNKLKRKAFIYDQNECKLTDITGVIIGKKGIKIE